MGFVAGVVNMGRPLCFGQYGSKHRHCMSCPYREECMESESFTGGFHGW